MKELNSRLEKKFQELENNICIVGETIRDMLEEIIHTSDREIEKLTEELIDLEEIIYSELDL